MNELLSPKQVARAIQVSESSVKRWCDDGQLQMERTAGGHRRIHVSEVLRFIRKSGHRLVSPAALGIPVSAGASQRALERAPVRLRESLITGSADACRQVILDLFVSGHSIAVISDQVIHEAFKQIGDDWACGSVQVYQERRACEITARILRELETLISVPSERSPLAIGGTLEGDFYTLPTMLVELVLRQLGFRVVQLGSSLPAVTIESAIKRLKPDLIWLSVSAIADETAFRQGCEHLVRAVDDLARHGSPSLVLGGYALAQRPLPDWLPGNYLENMQQLVDFADSHFGRQLALGR